MNQLGEEKHPLHAAICKKNNNICLSFYCEFVYDMQITFDPMETVIVRFPPFLS